MNHNWRNILVTPSATIQDVLKVIEKEALQLALVVDNDNRLLGTITDGDVRRALIDDQPLETPVSEIMFTTPTTVAVETPRDEILEIMDKKELFSIPIIENGRVVGLETLHKIIHKKRVTSQYKDADATDTPCRRMR